MPFIIEIMKARLSSSGFFRITLAFINCLRMPCSASLSTAPSASAISRSPACASGCWITMLRRVSLIRGLCLLRSSAATGLVLLRVRAVVMSMSPWGRAGARARCARSTRAPAVRRFTIFQMLMRAYANPPRLAHGRGDVDEGGMSR